MNVYLDGAVLTLTLDMKSETIVDLGSGCQTEVRVWDAKSMVGLPFVLTRRAFCPGCENKTPDSRCLPKHAETIQQHLLQVNCGKEDVQRRVIVSFVTKHVRCLYRSTGFYDAVHQRFRTGSFVSAKDKAIHPNGRNAAGR